MDNELAKLILTNQALMMRSISAILHAPGVTATDYVGNDVNPLNLHQQLRFQEIMTKGKILDIEMKDAKA